MLTNVAIISLIKMYISKMSRSGSDKKSDSEQVAMLAEEDMLPAIHNSDNKILTDENGKIVLRY